MIPRTTLTLLHPRITETITWCTRHISQAEPEKCLRTPALQPVAHQDAYRYGLLTAGEAVIAQLAQTRVSLLEQQEGYPCSLAPSLWGGKLLLYQPDASFADAIAWEQTQGFFDRWDAPPWDTWVWYWENVHSSSLPYGTVETGCLMSWVPPAFIDLAQAGIEANPYGTLCWLGEADLLSLSLER